MAEKQESRNDDTDDHLDPEHGCPEVGLEHELPGVAVDQVDDLGREGDQYLGGVGLGLGDLVRAGVAVEDGRDLVPQDERDREDALGSSGQAPEGTLMPKRR